ncbi:MAG TPA: glycosyltransferase [Burkholderiaceae bacterium]|nr:glycosyltransferase [Burkholderiaceae bacterium]
MPRLQRHLVAPAGRIHAGQEQIADADRVKVIYNGVDPARFDRSDRRAARARLGIAADAVVVLFVGNLKPAKGCIELLDAFSRICPSDANLRLVFIGGGDARAVMERRVAASALGDRVRFEGRLEHGRLPDWFAAANVLCLPSHAEGVPNVILEAMASGLPVVATRVGGIPEVVPPFAGLLVPPRDGAALAEALQAVLGRAWDAACIAAHARQFTWENNIDSLIGLLAQRPWPAGAPEARS